MDLFFRKTGNGPDLVILHGLYGSSDNWMGIARKLEKHFTVYLPDFRNHGQSPHHNDHNYIALSDDIKEFFYKQNISRASVLGHSMGGKAAMCFAARFPEYISSLIVADVSPVSYLHTSKDEAYMFHQKIIQSLLSVNIKNISTRDEVVIYLNKIFDNKALIAFLLKNLKQKKTNEWYWNLNLQALESNIKHLLNGVTETLGQPQLELSGFPVLFIKGELSQYITHNDYPAIYKMFPVAEIQIIKGASHWLHAEQPDEFVALILKFIFESLLSGINFKEQEGFCPS